MVKKAGFMLLGLLLGCGMVQAQDAENVPRGIGSLLKGGTGTFELNIDLDVTAFEYEKNTLSDIELRKWKGYHAYPGNFRGERVSWPFSGHNWFGDTNVSLAYNAGFFGGTLGLCVEPPDSVQGISYPVKASTIKGWVKPSRYFKATAGIDIESVYADSLDADPGMRIYNGSTQAKWADSRNPDNITQNEGVLLEGFFGPVTAALSGRYYNPSFFTIDVNGNTDEHTTYLSMMQSQFSYGARVGSQIGKWGKVNGSYIIEYSNYGGGTTNQYGVDVEKENIVITGGLAEVAAHLFGVYASLKPLEKLGLTLGYNGIITKYPEQLYVRTGATNGAWENTAIPIVYQQGINVNLRYTGLEGWKFRTDNSVNFWTDKNYSIYSLPGSLTDMGIMTETGAKGYADVNHFVMWNGLGVSYRISNAWKTELYTRNLYRTDTAEDTLNHEEFVFARDEFFVELKGIWQPNGYFEFYAGIELKNMVTTISKDVNTRTTTSQSNNTGFKTGVEARDTVDSTLTFRIPMGMTIKMR